MTSLCARILPLISCALMLAGGALAAEPALSKAGLARQIMNDGRSDKVEDMALHLLNCFNAGTSYTGRQEGA